MLRAPPDKAKGSVHQVIHNPFHSPPAGGQRPFARWKGQQNQWRSPSMVLSAISMTTDVSLSMQSTIACRGP